MLVFSGAQLPIGVVEHLSLSDPVLLREQNELFSFFPPVPVERSRVNNSFSPKGVLNPCASHWLSGNRRKGLSCCECSSGCSSQFITSLLLYQDFMIKALD